MMIRINNAIRLEWLMVFSIVLLLLLITFSCSNDPITGIQFEDPDDNEEKEDETPPSDGDGQSNLLRNSSSVYVYV